MLSLRVPAGAWSLEFPSADFKNEKSNQKWKTKLCKQSNRSLVFYFFLTFSGSSVTSDTTTIVSNLCDCIRTSTWTSSVKSKEMKIGRQEGERVTELLDNTDKQSINLQNDNKKWSYRKNPGTGTRFQTVGGYITSTKVRLPFWGTPRKQHPHRNTGSSSGKWNYLPALLHRIVLFSNYKFLLAITYGLDRCVSGTVGTKWHYFVSSLAVESQTDRFVTLRTS